MTNTLCHLLLPPLLLLFFCYCLAAVHGKVDADNQHSINETNSRFKAMISDVKVNNERSNDHFLITNSSQADFLCPASAAIAPCTCSVDSDHRVHFDCTFVESVDQLVEVFKQDFPIKELYEFSMANNSAINGFPSFMNGITFERVNLSPGPFTLAAISDYYLLDLKDTLKEFYIDYSKLATDFFPFAMLPSMNQLDIISITSSNINRIPQVRAPILTRFALHYSPLQILVNGTFPIGTGPMYISVNNNEIQTIEVGSFFFADQNSADSNEWIYIFLYSNELHSLRAGTFPLRNGKMQLFLDFNRISSIEPGTFLLPTSTDLLDFGIDLSHNQLTTVDEAVFGSIMQFISYLALGGNPLTCGCDMAWLILNEDFLATVDFEATCSNGTNLHDLDPQQYIDFC